MPQSLVGNFRYFGPRGAGFGRRSLLAIFQFPFRRGGDRFDCRQRPDARRRKPDAGQEAVKQLAAQNLSVQFHPLDTTRAESIAALCEFLEQSFGHLDALVNNAGIITKEEASGLEVKLAAVREPLETNTLAPLHLSQASRFPHG